MNDQISYVTVGFQLYAAYCEWNNFDYEEPTYVETKEYEFHGQNIIDFKFSNHDGNVLLDCLSFNKTILDTCIVEAIDEAMETQEVENALYELFIDEDWKASFIDEVA